MYQIQWGELTPETFLKEYWQKKPLLIKGAFRNFIDPIEADELAGLAMEVQIESRIVSQNKKNEWQVDHGPFEDYSQYGEQDWTLLVQATNNWSAPTQQLLTPFKFIPNWRIDDVMVSFSTPNGGVGPHLDQYDVFIIQGEGKRRWQVGAPDSSLTTEIPHPDLKQVSPFTPVIDAITEPGDLLYIPPNHPHNGVAIENSLNYSVGFQAPSNVELWSGFADNLIDQDLGEPRLPDADRQITENPELITQNDFTQIKQFMLSTLDNSALFNDFICKHLTTSHHQLDILLPEEPYTAETVDVYLDNADMITPVLGIKALFDNVQHNLYVDGDKFDVAAESVDFALMIAKNRVLTIKELKSTLNCLKSKQLLTTLLNMGFWYFE